MHRPKLYVACCFGVGVGLQQHISSACTTLWQKHIEHLLGEIGGTPCVQEG